MSNVKSKNAKKTKDIWYKVLTILVVAIFAVGLLIAVIKPTGVPDYISLHTNYSVKSDNYKVNNAQMNYLVYTLYNNYYSQYSSYASAAGLDSSKPLSQQKYWGSETTSWRDQLVTEATSTMERCLVLCESADKAGFTLTDEDKQEIADQMQSLKDAAKENGMSVSKMVRNYYGRGVTVSDIESLTEMQTLASKYATKISEDFTYVDADYDNFYTENKNDYRYADYKMYAIDAEYDDKATDEEKVAAQEAAKAAAEELKKAIEGGKSFTEAVYEYEQKLEAETEAEESAKTEEKTEDEETSATEESAKTEETPKTEEKTEEELKEEIAEKILKEQQGYTDDDLGKWIFADTPAEVNSVKVIGEEDTYTVYQVVKQPYRLEYNTVDVYYISVGVDSFEATADKKEEDVMEEAVKEIADKVAALTTKNGDEFTKLAESLKEQYPDLYVSEKIENIEKDTVDASLTVEEFDDWAFAEGIKAGDSKYFVSENAGYIFLYEAANMPAWKYNVDTDMRSEDYDEKYEAMKKELGDSIVINEKAQKKIAA